MSRKKGCTEFMVWSSVELQEIKAVDNTQEKNAKSKNVNQAVDDPVSNYEKEKNGNHDLREIMENNI